MRCVYITQKAMALVDDNFNAESDGLFKGYAAATGNVDLGGDIILKGAFNEWLQTSETLAACAYFGNMTGTNQLAKLYPCMKMIKVWLLRVNYY